MIKYAFIDRDGTIIEEPDDHQVDRLDKVRFARGVIPALLALQENGFVLVLVTNQDGLGTASFPRSDFEPAHQFVMETLESQGIRFADVLICPHKPEDGCTCRKPHLGLVRPYLTQDIDINQSVVIGDRQTDLDLATNMGLAGYQRGDWATLVEQIVGRSRNATVVRRTKETSVEVTVNLDGAGQSVRTGLGFFDHMLEQLSKHGNFKLDLVCEGDLDIDEHHTVEDCALALGDAMRKALGDKVGIGRYGFVLPMDEAQASASIDLGGRPFLRFDAPLARERVGELPTELVPHFFRSLSESLGATIHIAASGENDHHVVESIFKSVARALRPALAKTGSELPTTKGVL